MKSPAMPEGRSPSSTWYLRVEATNLDAFVYDTTQVSVIRGGSLLLLGAVDVARQALDNQKAREGVISVLTDMKVVSEGASIGLYKLLLAKVGTEAGADAERIRDVVRGAFREHSALSHATFAVDVVLETDGKLGHDVERLIALHRWRQLQSPTFAVPAWNDDATVALPCAVDDVSPGMKQWGAPGESVPKPIGRSANVRMEFGRKARQGFYEKCAGKLAAKDVDDRPLEFTDDLETLASDPSHGRMHAKIAVVYVDGNRFSAIRANCKSPKALIEFDLDVREKRRALLAKVLEAARADDAWRTPDRAVRLETLLWGGDEALFVVPAWKGWDFASFFFRETAAWQVPTGGAPIPESVPLTHAMGLVFCHASAPLHRIRALAMELADVAKASVATKQPPKNRLAYQVLESFDHTGDDLKRHRRRCAGLVAKGVNADVDPMVLETGTLGDVRGAMKELVDVLPRKRIHTIARELLTMQSPEHSKTEANDAYAAHCASSPSAKSALLTLTKTFPPDARLWLHLADLWDYLEA